MKYITEFRNPQLAQALATGITQAAQAKRHYRIMEFCGGHTHAIFRYGVPDLLPANVEFVHGPGCPVCVLPMARLDYAIALVEQQDVILCTYGDMLRVPASGRVSLQKLKALGADVRMVYSTTDALTVARDNPSRQVVFFAIGFETTTPPTAVAIEQAEHLGLTNFSVFCNHVLTPSAMHAILASEDDVVDGEKVMIDGFLGPAHVSSIIGSAPYESLAATYRRPVVIAGFEPLDVMQSTLMLIRQLNEGRYEVENEYTRVVTREGNQKAQRLLAKIFKVRDQFEWRGLGWINRSALAIRDSYARFDAERRFRVTVTPAKEVKSCECAAVLRGRIRPTDCRLFGRICTPENPMGSCMVSSEGACAAYWSYARRSQTGVVDAANPIASFVTTTRTQEQALSV